MDIYNDAVARLGSFGVTLLSSEKDAALVYAIEQAEEWLLNATDCVYVPDGLKHTFIDLACGFYLSDMKAVGFLNPSGVDFSTAPAKDIKEGDVQIAFATASEGAQTPEARFDSLINRLLHPDPGQIARYRRLVW